MHTSTTFSTLDICSLSFSPMATHQSRGSLRVLREGLFHARKQARGHEAATYSVGSRRGTERFFHIKTLVLWEKGSRS